MDTTTDIFIHDTLCEQQVIASLIFSNTIDEIRDLLSTDLFFTLRYQQIYQAISSLDSHGLGINLVTVMSESNRLGQNLPTEEFAKLAQADIPLNILDHVNILRDLSARRQLVSIGHNLIAAGQSRTQDIDQTRRETKDRLERIFSTHTDNIYAVKDVTPIIYKIIKENAKKEGATTGTPTGFPPLDQRGGLQPSDLIIIAGCSSAGKTSFAMSIANNALKQGANIAFYSMELTKEQLTARLLAMDSTVSSSIILYGKNLAPQQYSLVDQSMPRIDSLNLFFDDSSTSSIDNILSSIRTMAIRQNIQGAIIDYIQILNVNQKSTNKEQAMADVARRLKNIAKELNIWIIALSQLNRDNTNPVPTLNRLRDSGQIAEAADVVMLIYRPDKGATFPDPFTNVTTDNKALIDVAKGRNIGVFKFLVNFHAPTTHFTPCVNPSEQANSKPF